MMVIIKHSFSQQVTAHQPLPWNDAGCRNVLCQCKTSQVTPQQCSTNGGSGLKTLWMEIQESLPQLRVMNGSRMLVAHSSSLPQTTHHRIMFCQGEMEYRFLISQKLQNPMMDASCFSCGGLMMRYITSINMGW